MCVFRGEEGDWDRRSECHPPVPTERRKGRDARSGQAEDCGGDREPVGELLGLWEGQVGDMGLCLGPRRCGLQWGPLDWAQKEGGARVLGVVWQLRVSGVRGVGLVSSTLARRPSGTGFLAAVLVGVTCKDQLLVSLPWCVRLVPAVGSDTLGRY
jgi:hypothetical protein